MLVPAGFNGCSSAGWCRVCAALPPLTNKATQLDAIGMSAINNS